MSKQLEASLVAYLDILGTKDLVGRGIFSDFHSLDFANPVGLMALRYSDIRFAVFSDSVVVSCQQDNVGNFLSALNYMFASWFSDFIFVRGGLTLGEVFWVDHPTTDHVFRSASNLAYARLYGKALNEAIELQGKSGPGMVCFVSNAAAHIVEKECPGLILSGPANILAWTTSKQLNYWRRVFSLLAEEGSSTPEFQRHIRATLYYMAQSRNLRKGMPHRLSVTPTLKTPFRTGNKSKDS